MTLQLGDSAPNFKAISTCGEIDFYEYLGNQWGLLFSQPADFSPVGTTELGKAALLQEEFMRRGVRLLAVSIDSLDRHIGWMADINETQHCDLDFPIVADYDRKVAGLYGMVRPDSPDNFTVRSLFVIGPDKRIKLTLTYPASTGRNFAEILRVIDSLQLTAKHKLATPADWKDGQDCIVVTAVKDEDADKMFPRGVRRVKPYLRYTPQPN